MKTTLVIAVGMLPCCAAFAQDVAPSLSAAPVVQKPKCPSGPLLRHAPSFSKWTVTYNYKNQLKANVPLSGAKNPDTTGDKDEEVRTKSIQVTKTGTLIHEETTDTKGGRQQHWADTIGGYQITIKPGAAQMIDATPSFSTNAFYTDYAAGDFQGFSWISPKNFIGVERYKDQDCMIFTKDVSAAQQATQSAGSSSNKRGDFAEAIIEDNRTSTAVIALESRMPVVLVTGDETRVFEFGEPPTEMQTMPPNVQAKFAAHKYEMDKISRRPPQPF